MVYEPLSKLLKGGYTGDYGGEDCSTKWDTRSFDYSSFEFHTIHKHPPFQGLDFRIPIIIPIKGKGLINQGSTFKS